MKILLAQLNATVGDIENNARLIREAYQKGVELGVDLVVCPELMLTGYPPRDLLLKPRFIDENLDALKSLAHVTGEVGLVVGYVEHNNSPEGRDLFNSVALLHQGKVCEVRYKTLLPTYDVFDEDRYFEPATSNAPVEFLGKKIGLTICEDAWNDEEYGVPRRYKRNPLEDLAGKGCELIINISASPWFLGKNRTRQSLLARQSID